MSDKIEKKVQEALGRHDRGYNCSQSVACTFCDELGFDEETMFRITEGMGLGMGSMDGTCGAFGAPAVLARCQSRSSGFQGGLLQSRQTVLK